MKKLILLYWGTVFLMYLSQVYYPTQISLHGYRGEGEVTAWRRSDIFMVITIAWMTCFSFLRTSYNDSLLLSKRQKNNSMTRHLATGAIF